MNSRDDVPGRDARAGLCPADDFPITRTVTYLNSGGLGIIPQPVQRRTIEFAERLATQGTRAYFENVENVKLAPRAAGARLLNADPASIAIVNSVSEAMGQFAWWVRPNRDQNVVVIDIDHPSATFPWLRVAQETGAEVRFVRAASDPTHLSFDDIAALVDDRTAVISVSHVLWTTGQRFDLDALAELARSHGALLAIDATHSIGVIPVDAPASGADIVATGSFKWLCGFSGVGVCYLKPELMERIQPFLVGHNNGTPSPDWQPEGYDTGRIDFPPNASRMEYGSSSHVPRFTLGLSIDYLLDVGIANIQAHVQALGTRLAEGLERLGAQVLTPRAEQHRAGIITARIPGYGSADLTAALDAQDVVVAPRMGGVRFSPHLYNDAEDIERALSVVAGLMGR